MKGAIKAHNPGNHKLYGKLQKIMSCGCCEITNHKPKYFTQLTKKEISKYNHVKDNVAY